MLEVEQVQFAIRGGAPVISRVARGVRYILPDAVAREVEDRVNRWRPLVSLEQTYVAQRYGIPSFLVRADCTVDKNGILCLCEIEEPPAGAYLTGKVSPQFARLVARARLLWPPFRAFVSPGKGFSDVVYWLGTADEEYLEMDGLLWCVIRPEEADAYRHLIPRSVTPVRREGDKRPLAALTPEECFFGSAEEVLARADLRFPWVFKPLQGTRARGVAVWWGEGDFRPAGKRPADTVVSREKLERILKRNGAHYLVQPFYPPIPLGNMVETGKEYARYWSILRIYCAYVPPPADRYVVIGGLVNALDRREYAVIHGRGSSIFFPAPLSPAMEARALRLLGGA